MKRQKGTAGAESAAPTKNKGNSKCEHNSFPGQTKISTLQGGSRLVGPLRVYDGRSFAQSDATIGQVRKKRGTTSIDIRRNTKVGNLEDRFIEDFTSKCRSQDQMTAISATMISRWPPR